MISSANFLAASSLRLDYMSWWGALLLFAGLGAYVLLLGMRSLNGLGPVRKWVVIAIRLLVVLVFVLLLGGLRVQRKHKDMEVWVLRDISGSTELVEKRFLPPGKTVQKAIDDYLEAAAKDPRKQSDDRIGVISFQEDARVDATASKDLKLDSNAIRERGNGTDASAAIRLAIASMSPDTLHRILLIHDGNNTAGELDAAVAAAKSQGIPIDVMPLHYNVQNAMMIDQFIAPTWQRENQSFTLTVIIHFTGDKKITGKLTVIHHPGEDSRIIPVTLDPDQNPEHVQAVRVAVPALHSAGVHRFTATFKPDDPANGEAFSADIDKINRPAESFVFVEGQQQILYIDNYLENGLRGPGKVLEDALALQQMKLKTVTLDQFNEDLVGLQNYDAVILGNVPHGAGGMSIEQDQMLARYVHDLGGGLVMIGGEDSFGAGGWQGSKVADVLPVNMDVPAQRQVGKGALVLIMHSCEFPDGNYWGLQCALQAINTLSDRDEIGIISYSWNGPGGGGANWDFVLQEKGNGQSVTDAAKRMQLGDMPSFDDALNTALNGKNGGYCLAKSNARHKHVIIISDGDPAAPQPPLMQQYRNTHVSVSTVSVYPHPGQPLDVMKNIPEDAARDSNGKGGRAYGPINSKPSQLPQIFIKEATIVRRSLIQEDEKGMPVKMLDASDQIVAHMDTIPPVRGMVLTSKKDDPKISMPLTAGKLNDPILAHWQSGLGKTLVFTSDPTAKWGNAWIEWTGTPGYKEFWKRCVASVVRPAMSGDFDVQTTVNGSKGKVVVTGVGKDSAALNYLKVGGNVLTPDGRAVPIHLEQTGPGIYTAEFDASDHGSYVVGLNYQGKGESGLLRGGVVVNGQPEYRDLQSNDTKLHEIADKTGGNWLTPWDAPTADLFSRNNVAVTASPLPVWDWLLPLLLALILLDVATRRIAWDWASMRRMGLALAERVRTFTAVRKVKSRDTLDAFRRVREEVAETKFRPAEGGGAQGPTPPPLPPTFAPDPKAKFEAKGGVEGDITEVVGGASDKPIPPPPKKVDPKGGSGQDAGGYTSSLLEAKRRAQQQIKKKEEGQGPGSG